MPAEKAADDLFQLEPIQGYPMLQWKGKRPFTATHYYPAQEKESYGAPEEDGWINQLFWGDNLQVMGHLLKKYRGKVQLIYIDPPFDSKADYKKSIELKGKAVSNDYNSFEEKQYGDIWTNDEYLQFIYERLIILRELLAENGSIYLHCDSHRVHYLKCMMDEIFGIENFQNDIIWKRTGAHNSAIRYGPIHDTILYYTKSIVFTWNSIAIAYNEEYEKRFSSKDPNGRKFQPISLIAAGVRSGSTGKTWRGIDVNKNGNHWRTTIEKLDKLDEEGRIFWPGNGSLPRLKFYLDESKGSPVQDIWVDIPAINSQAKERGSYPTQKPEMLVERILMASSKPGDIIFDCFMGSGTTQAVAMKLGRRFIGADINLGAVQTATNRLIGVQKELLAGQNDLLKAEDEIQKFYTSFSVYNVNNYDVFRNPVQAREIIMDTYGITAHPAGQTFDGEMDGWMVKLLPVNRIASKSDLNELIVGQDIKAFEQRQKKAPNQPVERIRLICMGHEPDLKAHLEASLHPFKLEIEVVDILRERKDLIFRREPEAKISRKDGKVVIEKFYPLNLMQKLSLLKETVSDWREMAESVMIDFQYDGVVLHPQVIDIPEDGKMVVGEYAIPSDAEKIRVKITDLLSESLEAEV
jgi:site-specific DNA-methyltransferase (adenine-specific)/adenine-specific DNA-methyltransferase